MPIRLDLTQRALRDLCEIEQYSIDRWGRKVARTYVDGIASALDRIAEDPGILSREPRIGTDLFFHRVQKHILVCDVGEKSIVVLTVIHTSIDLPVRLAELVPNLASEVALLHRTLSMHRKVD